MAKNGTLFLIILVMIARVCAQHPGRDEWQQPERLMDSIGVREGMVIGEPGAGDGYFTLKLAGRVGPGGHIYANDINRKKLEILDSHKTRLGFSNITTILGEVEDPLLPDSTMDMIIMVYVFHDLEKPAGFLQNIRKDLKSGASVFLIERDPDRIREQVKHFLTRDEVIRAVEEGGFTVVKIIDDFPRDNIYICRPDGADQCR